MHYKLKKIHTCTGVMNEHGAVTVFFLEILCNFTHALS